MSLCISLTEPLIGGLDFEPLLVEDAPSKPPIEIS